jgi:hypothetical protein
MRGKRPTSLAASRAWYEQRVVECEERNLRPSRSQDEREGMARGYTRDRVRALRGELAPPDWHQVGKRARI